MNGEVTLGQLVEYVLKNRKGNAFKSYTEEAIASELLRGSQDGTMFYSTRADGSVAGVVTSFKDEKTNIMHVNDLLTSEPWVIGHFVIYFAKHFPNFTIRAMRRNKPVVYNTPKLMKKILKGAI